MIKTMQEAFDALDDLKQALNMAYSRGYREGQQTEREACAKVCDELHPGLATKRAAEIIRARGQA